MRNTQAPLPSILRSLFCQRSTDFPGYAPALSDTPPEASTGFWSVTLCPLTTKLSTLHYAAVRGLRARAHRPRRRSS
eukprot:5361717-Heterocapsa_arctica.AAC.1